MHLGSTYLHQRRLAAGLDRPIGDGRWRIYAQRGDGLRVTMGDREVAVPADRVLVLPPGGFRLRTLRAVVHLNLDLDLGGVPAIPAAPLLLPAESSVAVALAVLRRGPFPRRILGPAATAAAHLLIARALLLALPADPRTALDPPQLAPALDAMRGDPARAWANDDLARRCGLSRGGFIAAFRRHHGRTPQRWLMDLRLTQAADLLADPALDLDAIARRIGLADRSHLSRRFKALHGIPPAAWRRRGMGRQQR